MICPPVCQSSTSLLRLLLVVVLLPSCSVDTIFSDNVVADTRGIPIVNLVVEGPGGDMVPIEHSPIEETVLVFKGGAMLWFGLGFTSALVVCWGIKGKLCRRR